MDELVKKALLKWPNVPHCYGWLGLDARGDWYMRDDRVQALGPFLQAKGSRLRHEKLIDFIQRNYDVDERGQWFFQNGPQRVYVELESTPWVWRFTPSGEVQSHSGQPVQVRACLTDEAGHVYLDTALGLGRVHTQDMLYLAEALEARRWPLLEVQASELPVRYGYVASPQARQAGEKKAG
jgi:hypothetical protein